SKGAPYTWMADPAKPISAAQEAERIAGETRDEASRQSWLALAKGWRPCRTAKASFRTQVLAGKSVQYNLAEICVAGVSRPWPIRVHGSQRIDGPFLEAGALFAGNGALIGWDGAHPCH